MRQPKPNRAMIEPLESRRLLSLVSNHPGSATGGSFTLSTVEYQGELYSVGWDADHGAELWKSNGTPQGSSMVKDVTPGKDSSQISSIQVLDGLIFFTIDQSDGDADRELWRSDGTEGGTFELFTYHVTPESQLEYSDLDGIVRAGLRPVQNGNEVYFAADDSLRPLWMTDGTVDGTKPVAPNFMWNNLIGSVDDLVSLNGIVYFTTYDYSQTEVKLVRTDGTEQGTSLVYDFNEPATDAFETRTSSGEILSTGLVAVGNTLYLETAYWELWQTDGTPETTHLLTFDLNGQETSPLNLPAKILFTPFNNELLAYDRTMGWFLTDGTTGTLLPQISGAVSTDSNNIYFTKTTSAPETIQFWRSDGTPSGNTLLASAPDENAAQYTYTGAKLFAQSDGITYFKFSWGSDVNGDSDLWALGDTPQDAHVVDAVGAGNPVIYNGKLYFSGGSIAGVNLFSIDPSVGAVRGTVTNPYGASKGAEPESGVTVYLDADDDGQLDNGELSTVTDALGNFSFEAVTPGQYTLGLIGPTPAWQWINTISSTSTVLKVSVNIALNHTAIEKLAAADTSMSIISGKVFRDTNGNDNPDPGEGKSFVVFNDVNGNGKLDAGEASTRSDTSGNYQLTLASAGNRNIRVVPVKGWDVGQLTDGARTFALPGQTVPLNLQVARMETESGVLFYDYNSDGTQQKNEPGIPGIKVQISADFVSANPVSFEHFKQWTVISDSRGHYQFTGVPIYPPDPYDHVSVDIQPAAIKGRRYAPEPDSSHNAADGASVVSNFGSTTQSEIVGNLSAFGLDDFGTSDQLSVGWAVFLDKNNNAKLDKGEVKVLTTSGAWFTFPIVRPGTYTVCVIPRKGFKVKSASQLAKVAPASVVYLLTPGTQY